MSLLEIRKKFVQISGRYDLVVNATAWADNGANFYINAGQKFLEKRLQVPKSLSRNYQSLASGGYFLKTALLRAIYEIWASQTGEGRWQLEEKTLTELKTMYADGFAATDNGAPAYYARTPLRETPVGTDIVMDYVDGDEDVVAATLEYSYGGIIIMPPADGTYLIETIGTFYHVDLSADSDVNVWTEIHPMALLYASLYTLETTYRNTEGAKDWLAALETETSELEKDAVDEESYHVKQIRG